MENERVHGYIDPKVGHFVAEHRNFEIIVDLKEGISYERVMIPVWKDSATLKPDKSRLEDIKIAIEAASNWKLDEFPDLDYPAFCRKYKNNGALPEKSYMEAHSAWFQWFFIRYNLYNITDVPF